ncbi:MAG TPA: glycosyltransferase family 2 protein [Cytophagales bacterium]|nr:glycosyltransferase family 2 protein [Cytophagales bacterium]
MSDQPLVSVISVNYKQTGVTIDFLRSLSKISYSNIEVLLVDNGSGQDLPEKVAQQFPWVQLIVSKENLGFAGGNNLAIERAKGKYLLFLNNDTELEPDFLEPLVHAMEQEPTLGLVSPKIIYYDNRLIQYAGAIGISPYTGRGSKIGHLEVDQGQYDESKYTDLGHGAAMMIPIRVVKEVGMMPDIFFLYYEEHDWCEMIKRAGYKVKYVGQSKVYHKESVSVGRESPLKTYYMTRNRLLFMRRNYSGFPLVMSMLFFIFLAVPKNTIKFAMKSKALLSSFYKGITWNLTHFSNLKYTPRLNAK